MTIKYSPMIIALFYMLNVILCNFGLYIPLLNNIAGISLITWIFMYLTAKVFQFCMCHRLFLWYILLEDLLNVIDYYWVLPVTALTVLMMHSILMGIVLFIFIIIRSKCHDKSNKKDFIEIYQ